LYNFLSELLNTAKKDFPEVGFRKHFKNLYLTGPGILPPQSFPKTNMCIFTMSQKSHVSLEGWFLTVLRRLYSRCRELNQAS